MKKLTEEEIQKIVEESMNAFPVQNSLEKEEDKRVYSLLFQELGKEPDITLPEDFSDKVVKRIQTRKELISTIKYYFFLLLIILLCFGATLGTLAYMDSPVTVKVFSIIGEFKWALLFGASVLLLIQILDQVFLKKKVLNA